MFPEKSIARARDELALNDENQSEWRVQKATAWSLLAIAETLYEILKKMP